MGRDYRTPTAARRPVPSIVIRCPAGEIPRLLLAVSDGAEELALQPLVECIEHALRLERRRGAR